MRLEVRVKILAIDSSGAAASAAVLNETTLIGEITLNNRLTHSQSLLPMIDEVMRMTGTEGAELTCIAVAAGPGSFTGLRIGASTVKGLAMVYDKPIAAVPTVDALACNYYGASQLVCPLLDARRGQVYGGLYRFTEDGLQALVPQTCTELSELLGKVNALGQEVLFLGDGADAYRARIPELTEVPYRFAPPHLSKQRAGSVGLLALQYAKENKYTTAVEFVPEYLRKSQAEREREARGTEASGAEA